MTRKELLQSAKPILFITEMVKPILDGRKTVTRRCVKFLNGKNPNWTGYVKDGLMLYNGINAPCIKLCQHKPGDILYVRETIWQKVGHYLDVDGETKPSWYKEFKYVATDEKPETGWNYSWVKRPSIHMPKEAARIFLKVKDVRVERLQDIDGKGILAEGIDNGKSNPCMGARWENMQKMAFESVWNSTIKKSDLDTYGWDANPWVWLIQFERIIPD